jgi:hypothetical protein
MLFFRRKTLFHVEASLPDPEELKLRFRRRVLLLTFVGFLVVLTIPVARDLKPDLATRNSTRLFAEKILETRFLASTSRAPISLELEADGHSWKRVFHAQGDDCTIPTAGPEESWSTPTVGWKLQVKKEDGDTYSGRTLCLHPTLGLMIDKVPIGEGKLLVTALRENEKESAYLLLGSYGTDLQTLNHWNY